MAKSSKVRKDDSFLEGASVPIEGAQYTPEDFSKEVFATLPIPSKPVWPESRYPVPKDDYAKMVIEAAKPVAPSHEAFGPGSVSPQEDSGVDSTEPEDDDRDYPEDDLMATPAMPSGAPSTLANFEGIPDTGWFPADCTMAVGPNHVLLSVNSNIVLYNKSGGLVRNWGSLANFFAPVMPKDTSFIFDPVIAYDHYSARWIVCAVVRRDSPSKGSWIMLGVSAGSSPTGSYYLWATDATRDGSNQTDNWADYPMLGFDTQCIYVTANQFKFGGSFQYSKLRIFHKAQVYGGGVGASRNITWYDYWNFSNPGIAGSKAFTIIPCQHFRGNQGKPPAYFVNALWPSGDKLVVRTLENPSWYWTGGSGTWKANNVSCISYALPPDGQQPGTNVLLETNDTRVLKAVFQHAGGVQRLWCCLTSAFTWSGEKVARSVVNWYEIDIPSMKIVQQNRFGQKGSYYFFPSLQTDINRNMALVFGRCSSNEFPQLRQTGRRVSGAPNSLEGSVRLVAGLSANLSRRWGDYFDAARDPANTNTMWLYGAYADANGKWRTRAASVRY
jgi:hypothetical protein